MKSPMNNPVRFVIDMSGEHTTVTPTVLEHVRERYECPRHGEIGNRVFGLEITDGKVRSMTGPICIQCLANMLSCCRATKVEEEVLEEASDE